jgi:serine/threonine protein kinase
MEDVSSEMSSENQSRLIAGRYRLLSVLGSGSMGTVWSAYDETLHRPVAVKQMRLPQGVGANQIRELKERTLREARAIALLSHPNVITLHDVAREDDEPYVVMELLPSRSLTDLLREHGPLSVEQAAAVGDAVAAALEAAHQAGITHRDVKPGNVLISNDGRIKLTDFGISRNVSEVTMTHTGIMLGSPAYIAPEIASGHAVTPAADLWGLGATLFAVVEGQPPYDVNGDPMETINRVVRGPLPIPSPGPLKSVITGLMVKDPTERSSLAQVRNLLHPLRTIASYKLFGPEMFGPELGLEGLNTEGLNAEANSASGRKPAEHTPARTLIDNVRPKGTVQKDAADRAPNSGAADSSTELAASPGPLPFLSPSERLSTAQPSAQETKRGALATTALIVLAFLLFLAAVAGGFIATRAVGGQSIAPPAQDGQAAQLVPLPDQLETGTGDATNVKGTKGGLFTIQIPQGWLRFTTQQPASALPASTLVKFASPDGSQALGVQRYANFYPAHQMSEFLKSLETPWPRGDFVRVNPVATIPGREDGVGFTYRTIEHSDVVRKDRSASSTIGRTTFLQAFRVGNNLWTITVTVPTEQEELGQSKLFDRIAPTFTTTD